MQSSSEQPLVGEERYVMTRITAAKETTCYPAVMFCYRGLEGTFPARADSPRHSEFQDIFA